MYGFEHGRCVTVDVLWQDDRALTVSRLMPLQKRGLPRFSLLFLEKVTVLADSPLDHVEIQPDPHMANPS